MGYFGGNAEVVVGAVGLAVNSVVFLFEYLFYIRLFRLNVENIWDFYLLFILVFCVKFCGNF
jgi:hypothetical protein